MNSKINDEIMTNLYKAILKLENEDECRRFFDDICTLNELNSISQRLEVAIMLKNKSIYAEIAGRTGASTATISRVNRCLQRGQDGYKIVIDRLRADGDIPPAPQDEEEDQ